MSAIQEIEARQRFSFGENWTRFLRELDDRRINAAVDSLREMLKLDSLAGLRFLDIGSGSGLFSLAARRLGAQVTSFDFDPKSVACAQELRQRYFPRDPQWHIEQGSALDGNFMQSFGEFDVVYSWGVLHHTGSMWLGFENALARVAKHGRLFIAIYNDQGAQSRLWWLVKTFYNRLPRWSQSAFVKLVMGTIRALMSLRRLFSGSSGAHSVIPERGMSDKYDDIDWVGGFPFEFATFELLEAYFRARGFTLLNFKRTTSWGCNELVFRRGTTADV
ncbi:MAG: class I SAM-dependent methyltransferase [Pseudomonadota bacterium]